MKTIWERYGQLIRYGIIGVLTTIVSLLSYYLCVVTFLDPADALQLQIANVISWVCAVAFAYFTNRIFVFESRDTHRVAEAARFVSARVATLLMDMACMALLVSVLGLNDKWAKLLVQVIVFVSNYLLSRFLVFHRKND